ncbi:MAG: nickel/cobalt transporter (NicO) family protein [Gaiellales bacterium]|nr:nickel/cobalt transporter (NicO) family protein [Gaiellales bacterium]
MAQLAAWRRAASRREPTQPHSAKWHCVRVPLGLRRCAIVAVLLLAVAVPMASAHPLGNFTVNQYTRLDIARQDVSVRYVLDMAEIPTFQRRQLVDADHNGRISAAEAARESKRLIALVAPHLHLTADGAPVRLVLETARVAFPHGQGGLSTTRLDARFHAAGIALGRSRAFALTNTYATDRVGWRELLVARGPGVAIRSTDASVGDRTKALTHYPTDLLHSPPDVRAETTVAEPGSGGLAVQAIPAHDASAPARASSSAKSDGGFVSLVESDGQLTLLGALAALGLALVFGMVHALTPGHGKTMVAAYLAGTRGRARHALILGATVTITHTAGVFALGIVTLSLSQFIVPDQLYPWLNLASGVMVVGIGAFAIRDRLRRWLAAARPRRSIAGAEHEPGHGHDHGHDHTPAIATAHAHDHGHDHGHGHSHDVPEELSMRSLIGLGISGGLLPCPSALVVLLSAIALHRLAFGLALIVAFSLGLASVISGIGLAVLYARKLFTRLPSDHGRIVPLLPILSAVIITVLGLVLTARSLPGVM